MIVIADTTPLHYFILLGHAEILQTLFGNIIIPEAVFAEMQHEQAPETVRKWVGALPQWIEVKTPSLTFLASMPKLGKGETEAIALALEIKADALLADDKKAVREARRNNLIVVTTLGILERAAENDLLDLPKAIAELSATNFRMPPEEIIEEILKNADRQT